MIQIAILDDYQNAALHSADWDSLPDAKVTTFNNYIEGEDAVAEALASFDVVVAMRERTRFPKSLLERLNNLKLLVTTGMRNAAIDMEFAKAKGIVVTGTQMPGHSTYELTWALIMALAKQITKENQIMHEGGWQGATGMSLKGKTLGILGLGKIGSNIARIGNAFDMNVISWSQNLTDEKASENKVIRVEKEALFAESDFITIHLVLSDRTRGLVQAKELDLMKPSAYIVNTSRGPIIDESALINTLKNKKIAGAAIDVYDVEPLPADHPIRSLDNALLTGHTGYVNQEMYELAYGQAVEDIKSWTTGDPLRVING